ncbi:hypothetical protein HDV63DRAFT_34991 [Trichoderma sp. SZMC 28014]
MLELQCDAMVMGGAEKRRATGERWRLIGWKLPARDGCSDIGSAERQKYQGLLYVTLQGKAKSKHFTHDMPHPVTALTGQERKDDAY